jgi:hypothetical protein
MPKGSWLRALTAWAVALAVPVMATRQSNSRQSNWRVSRASSVRLPLEVRNK